MKNNIIIPNLPFFEKPSISLQFKLFIPIILIVFQLLIPSCIHNIRVNQGDIQFQRYQIQYTWYEWHKGKRIQRQLDRQTYNIIKEECIKNKFPLHYALAFVFSESRFNNTAISYAGARGLFQIMARMHKCDPQRLIEDPQYNSQNGIRILKWCFKLAKGDIREAAKNYNAGPYGTFYNAPYIKEIKNNIRKSSMFIVEGNV